MISIGNNILVFSQMLLIPQNEIVYFEVSIKEWVFKGKILFKNDTPKEKQSISFRVIEGIYEFIFINWNSSLGIATTSPAPIAKHPNGDQLYLAAANYSIGTLNKLDIQLFLGKQK